MRARRRTWYVGLALAACAALLAASRYGTRVQAAYPPNVVPAMTGGFTSNGGHPGLPLAAGAPIRQWGSWSGSDANQGNWRFSVSPAPPRLRFAVGGYPAQPGNGVFLERTDTGERVRLDIGDVGERWLVVARDVPGAWVGRPVMLTAVDGATGLTGWLQISEPLDGGYFSDKAAIVAALAAWAVNGALLGLLWVAAFRIAGRWRWVPSEWLPIVAAACVALAGYAAFWVYFAHPFAGRIFSVLMLASSAAMAMTMPSGTSEPARRDAARWGTVAIAVTFFYIAILEIYPSARDFYDLASWRFYDHLPGDNILPHLLAAKLSAGEPLRDPAADWLSSDRPPLQAGWLLLTWPATQAIGIDSQVASGTAAIWMQSLWTAALYGLLRTLGLGDRRAAAWLTVFALAGFFVQHTVYTWPKFTAGAFVIAAFVLGFLSETLPARSSLALGGFLAAMAWLSHGAAAFAFLGLAPWMIARAVRRREWRAWAGAGAIFLALSAPWMAYQRFYDPPANRLLKWHFAGQIPKDPRGTWEAIADSYGSRSWKEVAQYKIENLRMQLEGRWRLMVEPTAARASERRIDEFFHTARALAWFPFVAAAAIVGARGRWRRCNVRAERALLGWALCTTVIWCLLLFMPRAAGIHQGSFVAPMVLFVLCAVWAESGGRWWLAVLLALEAMTFTTTYAVPNVYVNGPATGIAFAAIGALAVAVIAGRGLREPPDRPAAARAGDSTGPS